MTWFSDQKITLKPDSKTHSLFTLIIKNERFKNDDVYI